MAEWLLDFFNIQGYAWSSQRGLFDLTPLQGFLLIVGIPAVVLIARLLSAAIHRFYLFVRYRGHTPPDQIPVLYFHNSIFFIVSMMLISVILVSSDLIGQAAYARTVFLRSGWTLALAWFLYRLLSYVTFLVEQRMNASTGEAWRVRGVKTQMIILRRVAAFIVCTLASSILLLQFEVVQQVGLSLLASAGVAGIVIGLAAQKSIASILYGIQLALTQPVRIGDTVIIEGEWGQIEEIHLTYVVLRIWDERRLVVPVERVLNQSFENWTRTSPQILGTVFVYVDARTPIVVLRKSLESFVEKQPLWDRRVCNLQVTNLREHSVELRALVSAADAGKAWDLRCAVREWFMDYLSSFENGRYLPAIPIASLNSVNPAEQSTSDL